MRPALSQNQQREISTAFQDACEGQPGHGALFALDGKVYQFLKTPATVGVWKFICPQQGGQPYGVEYILGDSPVAVPVCLPPVVLMAAILEVHGFIPDNLAVGLARLCCDILKTAGWKNPVVTEVDPVPGTVVITEGDKSTQISTVDVRPLLAFLSDPTVRGVLIEEELCHTWMDLNGKTIRVFSSNWTKKDASAGQ